MRPEYIYGQWLTSGVKIVNPAVSSVKGHGGDNSKHNCRSPVLEKTKTCIFLFDMRPKYIWLTACGELVNPAVSSVRGHVGDNANRNCRSPDLEKTKTPIFLFDMRPKIYGQWITAGGKLVTPAVPCARGNGEIASGGSAPVLIRWVVFWI